jgi:xylulokinase
VAQRVPDDPVEALAISSQGETFVPVDGAFNPLGPAILNSDNRAVEQSLRFEREFGKERIYGITGLPPHPMYSLNKILWLKDHQADLFRRTRRFLTIEGFLHAKMGLPPYVDHALASRTMGFDISGKRWSDPLLAFAGITEEKLGIPRCSGEKAGETDERTASILGLRSGTVIAVGGHDQPCGAFGCGVIDEGDVADSAGSFECLSVASSSPRNTSQALSYSLNSYCHVVPGRYITLAFFPAGFIMSWFVDQFCQQDRMTAEEQGIDVYQYLAQQIEKAKTGPTGICVTPHVIGSFNPYWDVRATGSIIGLTPQATRLELYRAVHEGIACELSINVETLEEVVGPFDEMTIYGGMAGSPFSVQLRADLTQKRVRTLHTSQAVCQGAAMLAGKAIGAYRDFQDAVSKVVRFDRSYEPDAETAARYQKQLRRYRLIHPSLEPIRAGG